MENKTIWIIGLVLLGIFLYSQGSLDNLFATVGLKSPEVVFLNEPIIVKLDISNVTGNLTVFATLNSIEVQPDVTLSNNTYLIAFYNLTEPGLLKISITDEIETKVIPIQVSRPIIRIENDIPLESEKGKKTLTIFTKDNKGHLVDMDSLIVRVTDPSNNKQTITPVKNTMGTYTFEVEYKESGNYIFNIIPIKQGYDSLEYTAITAILKFAKFPMILWVLIGGISLWLFLFIIQAWRKRR